MVMPFNEASFLECGDPELMAMVADDMHKGYCTKAMLGKQASERVFAAAAKIDYSYREGWNEADYWLEIDSISYAYWAQREGRDCWADTQFRAQYARDNPECVRRNKTGRTIITSGWEAA